MMTSSDTIYTSSYIDHVFTYTGHSYNKTEKLPNLTLYSLNELARRNRLILCRRQISNRDVRILIQNTDQQNDDINTDYSINTDHTSIHPNTAHNKYLQQIQINRLNTENTKNFKKFLFNFNKIAFACYLTVINGPEKLWSTYNIPLNIGKDTNFYVIESSPTINERYIRKLLEDSEFVNNYFRIIYKIHTKLANMLHKNLNIQQTKLNKNFYNNTDDTDNDIDDIDSIKPHNQNQKDLHIFRSFRILGLRHRLNDSNITQNERFKLQPFSEIVEIRSAFDIRQFENKKCYDCFIECELSYYKISMDISGNPSLFWINYLNRDLMYADGNIMDRNNDNNLDTIEENSELNDRLKNFKNQSSLNRYYQRHHKK